MAIFELKGLLRLIGAVAGKMTPNLDKAQSQLHLGKCLDKLSVLTEVNDSHRILIMSNSELPSELKIVIVGDGAVRDLIV